MYIPNNAMNAPSRRYGYGYNANPNRTVRMAGSCCPTKTCNCGGGRNCGCGNRAPQYHANTPGAASGQAATMMMPNIVINVQSGNRRSNDYTDAHNASTSYSPQSSENNPYYFAPTTTEQNPFYTSYEHGGIYSSSNGAPNQTTPVVTPEAEVVPMILSPRATAKKQMAFDPGKPPSVVGRRYPLEFP